MLASAPEPEGVQFVIEGFHQPRQNRDVIDHAKQRQEIRDRIHWTEEIHQAGHHGHQGLGTDGPVLAPPVRQAQGLQQAQIVLELAQCACALGLDPAQYTLAQLTALTAAAND